MARALLPLMYRTNLRRPMYRTKLKSRSGLSASVAGQRARRNKPKRGRPKGSKNKPKVYDRTLKFDSSLRRGKDEVVLRVSPYALDRAFAATDPEMYQSVHDGKVAQLMKLPEGTRVPAPKIAACDGRLGFEDGRHRARVAKLQGLKVIPVLVPKDNVADVRQLLAKFPRRPPSASLAPHEGLLPRFPQRTPKPV